MNHSTDTPKQDKEFSPLSGVSLFCGIIAVCAAPANGTYMAYIMGVISLLLGVIAVSKDADEDVAIAGIALGVIAMLTYWYLNF